MRSTIAGILLSCANLAGVALAQVESTDAAQEPAPVEEQGTRLEVRVVSVAGERVFIDVGREDGLRAGDKLRLLPAGGSHIEVLVLAVAANQSRVALPAGTPPGQVVVGTLGEVWLDPGRLAQEPPAQSPQVEHPPWSAAPEEWSTDTPLLAPAVPVAAWEREVEWRGFAHVSYDATHDDGRTYSLARTGLDLEGENLFGQGGILQLDLDGWSRSAKGGGLLDSDSSQLALSRLSYAWGGLRDEPQSIEVGRFMQRLTPQFGVLDGAEFGWRLDSGDHVGFSLGFLPDWSPEMKTGKDLAVATSWRHLMGAQDALELGLGLQKTWHEGSADRDQAVASLDWAASSRTRVHASAGLDYYDGSEPTRDQGVELTEGLFNTSFQLSSSSGVGLSASRFLRPDLLRDEYTPVSPLEVMDYEATRGGLNAWVGLGAQTRLSGRFDLWRTAGDTGDSAELRVARRDLLAEQDELALSVYLSEGRFTDVAGARLGWTRWLQAGYLSLGLDSGRYEQLGFEGSASTLWQHAARVGFDRDLGEDWALGLWAEQRFGDEQKATNAGFSLGRRF